jgi:hypothetical protein
MPKALKKTKTDPPFLRDIETAARACTQAYGNGAVTAGYRADEEQEVRHPQ